MTVEQRVAALEQSAVRYGSLTAPGGGAVAVARLRVGLVSAAMIQQVSRATFAWSPGTVAAQSSLAVNFTVLGVRVGDVVIVNPPSISNAPMCSAFVTANDTVQLGFVNPFASPQTPPAGTYTLIAIRAT